ncbi:MAG: hypothetical protein Q8S54_10895 [Bacteroidota bacterium]|nr:hypothetical protein [Bacteroidota bacterium]
MQKIGRIGIWLILILIFLFQLQTQAQSKKYFVITGRIVPEVGEAGSGVIEVKKNQNEITNIEIPKNGRFRFELEFFNEYYLTFKYPGHFNKIIIVSTEIPKEVWERDNDFPPFPMIVQMQQEFEGIDKSFTLKPQGKIFYGKEIDNFEKESYISEIQFQEQIETAKSQANQVQKEAQSISKENAQDLAEKQKNFDQLIKEADTHYQRGEYQMALMKYMEARKLFPEKAYPNDRVAELQDLVKALEITAKQKADLELKYQSAITKANGFFDQKTYISARPLYEEALQYKPGDVFANGRINEIDQLLALQEKQKQYNDLIAQADNNYKSKNYDRAISFYNQAIQVVPEDQYPKNQIALINAERLQQAKTEQIEKDFNFAIQSANTQTQQKDYLQALNSYKRALELKPDSKLAKDKIAETELAIVAIEIDKKYLQAIQLADQAMAGNDFQKAKMQYLEALKIKSGETYPKNKLNEIALSESQEIEFNGLVANAEKAFASNNFDESFRLFNQALEIKPKNQAVQKRIDDIQKIQKQLAKDQEQKEKNYQSTITQADKLFEKKDYTNAQTEYRKAMDIKPEEIYPKDQIRKIDDTLAQIRKQEEENQRLLKEKSDQEYFQAMANADKAFSANDFTLARTGYQTALSVKPNDAVAKEKLGQTEAKLGQIARMTQAYNTAITEANRQLTAKQYKEAKEKYQEALQYLPDSEYPKKQITKIDEVLAQQEAEIKLRQDFNQALAEGETLLKSKELTKAKEAYLKAYNLIPSEPVPPKRISEINDLLAEKARKDSELKATTEAYQNAIQRADKHFGNKDYSSARLVYNEAILIKSDEQYPVDQLALIEKLINEQNEQQYKSAITLADNSFNANQFDEAKTSYLEALKYKKDDQYATRRLKEIDQKKAGLEAENNRLKKLQDEYNAAIADAGNDFKNKDYLKSKGKYQKALTLKPAEILPKDQIAKIDQILAELQKEEDINRQYAQHIKLAQEAFTLNKLKEARDEYQKAYNFKPFEPVPPARIAEIDKMLALLAETAQLAAMEEAQRLAKEKADKYQYDNAIAAADKSFTEKQYKIARTHYTTALIALPNEKYPKDQIAKIDVLLRQQELDKASAIQQAQRDSLQKAREKLFDLAMSAAKEHEQNKQYRQAITKYGEAIQINPSQRSAIQKLINDAEDKLQLMTRQDLEYKRIIRLADDQFAASKLEDALAQYQNAMKIKPEEEYPKKQITEIQAILTTREQNYTSAIQKADQAFDTSDWQMAKISYTEALAIKPKEAYPAQRLKEVNQRIADLNLAELNLASLNKAYAEALEKAEKSFKENQLTTARIQFEVARSLKPDEKVPVARIKEIDGLLEQRNKDRLAQAQRELDEKYLQAISVADNSFRAKSYSIAKLQYKQASIIKPDESYPKDQMTLCDKLLSEVVPVETYVYKLPEVETAKPAARPVFNPAESAQATEARAKSYEMISNYDEAVKRADDSFGIKDYSVARFFYLKASDIKPKEEYPKNQLELIRKLIDSQLSANDVSGYDNAISKADDAFAKQNYTIAKFFYYKAIEIKSWEKYPKDRINEILLLTNSLLSEKEEKEYRDFLAKADEAFYNKDMAIARFYYNKAITIKKDENYPQIKLKDIQKLILQDNQDQQNQEYSKIIEQADQALQAGNFSIARFNYNKALTLRPDEKYPKDQLKSIKAALEKQK